jgi:hypothetical protein
MIALAIVVCAWYVLGIRQSRAVDQASATVSHGGAVTAAEARQASAQLSSARFLNPDRQVDVLRAELYLDRGDLAAAQRILKSVVRSEPDNLAAWIALARSSIGDPKDFYAAAFRIRQLVPPVPPPP